MKVSVVIPTHNRYQKLTDLIESLRAQDFPETMFEIIVIDNGSFDKTESIVRSFNPLPRIRYLFQKNQGPSAARNRGIQCAAGEIVVFVDDDMIAPPDWISRFVRAFEKNPQFAVIQAGCRYSNRHSIFEEVTNYFSSLTDKIRIIPSDNFNEGLEADYIGTGNFAICRKRLGNFELKFDERLITREDEDFFRSLRKNNFRIGFIDNRLTHRPSVGIIPDAIRFFNYGRGETVLRQKWGNYERFRVNRSYRKMREVFRPPKVILTKIILEMRFIAFRVGYYFESCRCAFHQGTRSRKLLRSKS